MRELFDNGTEGNPVEAARRSVRRSQRKRFYENATAVAAGGRFAVRLDDKPVRTPAGRLLAAPTLALARAIAAEWNAQRDVIDPANMPVTRLANAIIDGVSDRAGPVAAEVEKYLASDLVCYRAVSPEGLVERQVKEWDPLLHWAGETLGAVFLVGEGVIHVTQPAQALAAAGAAVPDDPWRLGAVSAVTTLTGSALIALALARGRLSAEQALRAANVDEDWNVQQWGDDEEAVERRTFRFAELQAAATVLSSLSRG